MANHSSYDAIIIGAGHNGLVTAAYLQRGGLNTLVLEKNGWVGGAATSRSHYPNFTYSNCSYVCSLFRPEIIRDLELDRQGLQIVPYEGGLVFTSKGDYLWSARDHHAHRREIERFSRKDAQAYDIYARDVTRQCRLIQPLLLRTPPDPFSLKPRDIGELIYLIRRFTDLGGRELAKTLRFWTMSIADFLDEYFENDLIKASLAGSGIIGTGLGPMSPGSAYVLLHHYMGEVDGNVGAWGYARGGMGAITQALANSLKAKGGTILTDAGVQNIESKAGVVKRVYLSNGDSYEAPIIVSNADLKRTFLTMVPEGDLAPDFLKRVRQFKSRGSSGKMNIALDGLPNFKGVSKDHPGLRGDMHFTDTMERMERGYDDWKQGRWSADPWQDLMIPSLIDPTLTPTGKHFLSSFVQYCPPKILGKPWSDADRDAFANRVIDQIEEYAPGFRNLILHYEVRTPRELEAEVGLTDGNIFQGELTFDQLLFNRPLPGYADYRTPLQGLYLCGSTTHPGGGVMGAPGRNAAKEILIDLRRSTKHMSEAHEIL